MNPKQEVAAQFGISLDNDDFETTKSLLSGDCSYIIGDTTLNGPVGICKSYKDNMIAGRKKLDDLVWGESRIEPLEDDKFYVHFTDYLYHKAQKYTHRCKQLLFVNADNLICRIEHIHDEDEQERLNSFYREVGILKQ